MFNGFVSQNKLYLDDYELEVIPDFIILELSLKLDNMLTTN